MVLDMYNSNTQEIMSFSSCLSYLVRLWRKGQGERRLGEGLVGGSGRESEREKEKKRTYCNLMVLWASSGSFNIFTVVFVCFFNLFLLFK